MKTIRKKTTGYKEENLKEDIIQEALDAGGGGGGGTSFIDVTELPTENIDSNIIYRVFEVYGFYNYMQNITVHIVDTLPATGENCTVNGSELTVMYYNKSDDNVYGYVSATIGAAFGVTAGWYPASDLMNTGDITYGGIIDDPEEIEEDKYYFVRRYSIYNYTNKWNVIKDEHYLICLNNFTNEDTSFTILNVSDTDTTPFNKLFTSKEVKITIKSGSSSGVANLTTCASFDAGPYRIMYNSGIGLGSSVTAIPNLLLASSYGSLGNMVILNSNISISVGLIKLYAK